MNYWDKKIVREQLDAKLKPLKEFSSQMFPEDGWIKTIRQAVGLTISQLSKKAGMDPSRVSRLEKQEKEGKLTVSSLKKIANGLGMKFVYGFVPEKTLEDIVYTQAKKIVTQRLQQLEQTMGLEAQSLSDEERKKAREDMILKTLIDDPKDFWDE